MGKKSKIWGTHNCYGCSLCSVVCTKDVIRIELNNDGFYEPVIVNPNNCTNCGLCYDVCAFNHKELASIDTKIESWAAWSNNEDVRRKCSSGGIGFEIGKQLIEKGYKAVGCRYDVKEQRAEHYIAATVEEFVQSIGSKYIQSYTEETFRQIHYKNEKYLIVGTPCQIDSFRRMIQKFHCEDNFILMDFFCHCVPSMWAWKAYIKMLEPKIGKVIYASWRNKFQYGWHDSWLMGIDGDKTSKSSEKLLDYEQLLKERETFIQRRWSQGDWFYNMFLGDYCMGSQCQTSCKYKYDKSSADIRIGDLWGKTYEKDQKGVSALIAFTSKGKEIIAGLQNVTLIRHPFSVVAEGQMKTNVKPSRQYNLVMWLLRHKCFMNETFWNLILKVEDFPHRVIGKMRRTIGNS